MLSGMSRLLLAAACAVALLIAAVSAAPTRQASPAAGTLRWYKGNTHTHTVNSDGDSTPDEVVRWYREHAYQFLFLTDHNYLTAVDGLNAVHGAAEKFIVIRGEEVTMRAGTKPIHVNGLDVTELVPPPTGGSVVDLLQQAADGIRRAGGVPHVNHPNFGWAITTDELRQLERTRLVEIFNGHPQVNNLGGGGVPGMEEVWDRLLSSGRLMFGLAVDDAHTFKRPGDPTVAGPGRAWIVVRAPRLAPRDIVEAIERGDFYASTGVELSEYAADRTSVRLAIKPDSFNKYRVQFIGSGGRLLSEQTTPSASYLIKGDEGYIRARIMDANGHVAWTQPVPVGSGGPK